MLGKLCAGKEYAKADSRYASRDPFTICMEFVTAFIEGPSCFLIIYGLVKREAWRHVLQLLVVTCQVYGDILYFATSWYEGMLMMEDRLSYFACVTTASRSVCHLNLLRSFCIFSVWLLRKGQECRT